MNSADQIDYTYINNAQKTNRFLSTLFWILTCIIYEMKVHKTQFSEHYFYIPAIDEVSKDIICLCKILYFYVNKMIENEINTDNQWLKCGTRCGGTPLREDKERKARGDGTQADSVQKWWNGVPLC